MGVLIVRTLLFWAHSIRPLILGNSHLVSLFGRPGVHDAGKKGSATNPPEAAPRGSPLSQGRGRGAGRCR